MMISLDLIKLWDFESGTRSILICQGLKYLVYIQEKKFNIGRDRSIRSHYSCRVGNIGIWRCCGKDPGLYTLALKKSSFRESNR